MLTAEVALYSWLPCTTQWSLYSVRDMLLTSSGGHCGHQLLKVLSAKSASKMFELTPQAGLPNPSF